jgi:hypothetical protein
LAPFDLDLVALLQFGHSFVVKHREWHGARLAGASALRLDVGVENRRFVRRSDSQTPLCSSERHGTQCRGH